MPTGDIQDTIKHMFGTMELQIQYLLLLQHLRHITQGIFDGFFMSATWFGEVIIPLGFIALVYWSLNKKAGTFLLFSFGLTLYVNVFLKMTACINRPWIIDSRIHPIEQAMPAADGYSFPSGHTAGAVSVWGGSAFFWWHNKFIRYFMIFLVLLVGFSRNYVGVHTPQDVIVSLIAGICILFSAEKIIKWTEAKTNRDVLLFAIISIMTLILYMYIYCRSYVQMQNYNCLTDSVNPLLMKYSSYNKIGFLLGIFLGWLIERRFVKFDAIALSNVRNVAYIALGLSLLYTLMFITNKYLVIFMAKQIASATAAFITSIYITAVFPLIIKITANRQHKV